MSGLKGKRVVKQDNGKVVVVNRNTKNDNSAIPSEWSLSKRKLSSRDINMINQALGKKKKRKR